MTTSAAPRDQSGPCSECRNSATLPRFLVLVAVFATLGAFCSSLAQERVSTPDDAPLRLPPVTVNAAEDPEFDATGMGSLDEQLRDEPFANDLIKPIDTQLDESMTADLGGELAAVAQPSPADRISGEERLNLRGFPTPVMRNGFVQLGISDYLNTARTVVIQGPLVPVLGRAAPGGIQDMQTARPQAKERQRFDVQFTSLDRQRVQLETTGPLVKKKLWQRLAVDWQRRTGPEQFTREEWLSINTALTWRHSRSASTLVSADYRQVSARVTPGIPEYRPIGGLIAGPYLPLALFNANGPDAAVRRRAAVVGVQFDGAPTKTLALRANAEGWWRDVVQDRFTTSVLSLESGLFEGTREPRHVEQPQHAFAAQLELTNRFKAFGADHKLLASASHTWGEYGREDRALPTAARDALPLSVRRFNPFAPDYYRPDYDAAVYSRILTDRTEYARYTAFELSDRAAFRRGRYVVSTGLRYDAVSLRVEDRKVNAAFPRVSDGAAQLSYHAGLNWQVKPSRLLAFASISTAFDPSTRVDARTGRIQDNETTLGYEAGFKGRFAKMGKGGAFEYSTGAFLLYNQHISRRNPLYDDPVFDPNQTQPQLVAAGEERYQGVRAEARWQATPALSVSSRIVAMRAITTASPDLPQEIGRAISRLPALTSYLQVRYRQPGPKGGPFVAGTWQYLSNYVANYADTRRTFLKYPGYGLLHASVGYSWRTPKRTFEIEAGTRNLLDRDLVASNARLGAQREFTFSTRVIF
jgi:iron complex outermembrane recepter protein